MATNRPSSTVLQPVPRGVSLAHGPRPRQKPSECRICGRQRVLPTDGPIGVCVECRIKVVQAVDGSMANRYRETNGDLSMELEPEDQEREAELDAKLFFGYHVDRDEFLRLRRRMEAAEAVMEKIRAIDAQWGHFAATEIPEGQEGTSFAAVCTMARQVREAVKAANRVEKEAT